MTVSQFMVAKSRCPVHDKRAPADRDFVVMVKPTVVLAKPSVGIDELVAAAVAGAGVHGSRGFPPRSCDLPMDGPGGRM